MELNTPSQSACCTCSVEDKVFRYTNPIKLYIQSPSHCQVSNNVSDGIMAGDALLVGNDASTVHKLEKESRLNPTIHLNLPTTVPSYLMCGLKVDQLPSYQSPRDVKCSHSIINFPNFVSVNQSTVYNIDSFRGKQQSVPVCLIWQ